MIRSDSPNSSHQLRQVCCSNRGGNVLLDVHSVGNEVAWPISPWTVPPNTGVTVEQFGTDWAVYLDGLDEVLVPLEEFHQANCCSGVELDELDSTEEVDLEAIWLGLRDKIKCKRKGGVWIWAWPECHRRRGMVAGIEEQRRTEGV